MKLRLNAGNDRSWLEPHLSLLRNIVRVEPQQHESPPQNTVAAADYEMEIPEAAPPDADERPVRLDDVLNAIRSVEGFGVCIRNADDRRVRGDLVLHGCGPYPFRRKLNEAKTVNTWKLDRLFPNYPIFDSSDYRVEVLDGDGNDRAGHTKLRTLRDSYFM